MDCNSKLTACIQQQCNQRAILGLEALEQGRQGQDIEYHVDEAHVQQRVGVQSVHCKRSDGGEASEECKDYETRRMNAYR